MLVRTQDLGSGAVRPNIIILWIRLMALLLFPKDNLETFPSMSRIHDMSVLSAESTRSTYYPCPQL